MFASTSKDSAARKTRHHLEEAKRNGKSAAGNLDEAAHAIGKDVRDFIEDAIDSASENLTLAKEKLSDTSENAISRIRGNPLTSVAVALGAGVIVGAFLRRR